MFHHLLIREALSTITTMSRLKVRLNFFLLVSAYLSDR